MKNWGIIISAFYALALVLLIIPGILSLSVESSWAESFEIYEVWLTWIWLFILLGGQILLIFLSADGSGKRLKPQRHIMVTVATIALLMGLLSFAALWSLLAGVFGDKCINWIGESQVWVLVWWLGFWALWSIIFHLYTKRDSTRVSKLVGWLIKGSILELLIAVPCHIIVRHREDCCAPAVTGFGIATGIAVMLLSFGPSVLFLYSKRMKQYEKCKSSNTTSGESSE